MASGAQVTLRGRYKPGTVVRLVKVRDESVLRSEGGELVDTKKVDDDGQVTFKTGVEKGGRYFIVGQVDGSHVEVRVRGNAADDDTGLAQAPVSADRVRLSDGSWADEAPEHEKPGFGGVGPAPGQHQVPKGTVQRSDTARGTAHPVDPDEKAPYPAQSDVKKGTVQRSATEHGQATPIAHDVPVSQQEVREGTLQRSDTPVGVATPIPDTDAVEAQKVRESAETKASVGEPGKAAALPPDHKPGKRIPDRDPAVVRTAETEKLLADVPPEQVGTPEGVADPQGSDGRDPQGQPLAADVAAAAGVEPASKPAVPVKSRASSRSTSKKEKK